MKMTLKSIEDWQIHYDKETDELFVGLLPQPEGTENSYQEGVMYCVSQGKITGFFIEYFKTQFEKKGN